MSDRRLLLTDAERLQVVSDPALEGLPDGPARDFLVVLGEGRFGERWRIIAEREGARDG
jgi:hypothetical protein